MDGWARSGRKRLGHFGAEKARVRERATLGAHRCERTSDEDRESALIAAWATSLATVLAGQTTLKVSAEASDARGAATGARRMEKRMYS